MQSVFCQRPLYAASTIEKQLERAYFPRLRTGSRIFYKNIIGEIMGIIHECPESEWNRPLKDTYLMGYYLQRSELYKARKETETTEQEEN
jgi:CRISPR-associated protein Csd1